MARVFAAIAAAERKFENGAIRPLELGVILAIQRELASEAINELFAAASAGSGKSKSTTTEQVRSALAALSKTIGNIHNQPAAVTVDAVRNVLSLAALTSGELGCLLRNLVDEFDIKVWLLQRMKDPVAMLVDDDAVGDGVASAVYSGDDDSVPKTGMKALVYCAQLLAAIEQVGKKMCAAGFLEILHDCTISSRRDGLHTKASAIASIANLMRADPTIAGPFILSKRRLLKSVREMLSSLDERARIIALRFVHTNVCRMDEVHQKIMIDSKIATEAGKTLGMRWPQHMVIVSLEIINALAYAGPAFRHELLLNDDNLMPNIKQLAKPQWLDDFRGKNDPEARIRRLACSCLTLLKPMAKELKNFGVLKSELTRLKSKAASMEHQPSGKQDNRDNDKENLLAGAVERVTDVDASTIALNQCDQELNEYDNKTNQRTTTI